MTQGTWMVIVGLVSWCGLFLASRYLSGYPAGRFVKVKTGALWWKLACGISALGPLVVVVLGAVLVVAIVVGASALPAWYVVVASTIGAGVVAGIVVLLPDIIRKRYRGLLHDSPDMALPAEGRQRTQFNLHHEMILSTSADLRHSH
jgi:hypothetical protein